MLGMIINHVILLQHVVISCLFWLVWPIKFQHCSEEGEMKSELLCV